MQQKPANKLDRIYGGLLCLSGIPVFIRKVKAGGRYVASLVMLRVLDILFFKYQNIYFL